MVWAAGRAPIVLCRLGWTMGAWGLVSLSSPRAPGLGCRLDAEEGAGPQMWV